MFWININKLSMFVEMYILKKVEDRFQKMGKRFFFFSSIFLWTTVKNRYGKIQGQLQLVVVYEYT